MLAAGHSYLNYSYQAFMVIRSNVIIMSASSPLPITELSSNCTLRGNQLNIDIMNTLHYVPIYRIFCLAEALFNSPCVINTQCWH
jgi:hypothetical protein